MAIMVDGWCFVIVTGCLVATLQLFSKIVEKHCEHDADIKINEGNDGWGQNEELIPTLILFVYFSVSLEQTTVHLSNFLKAYLLSLPKAHQT